MTTAAGAGAFFYKGTNRAMVRFTMMDYLCDDLQYIADTTRPPDRIRQDPARSPGGDSRAFLNQCIGCHSGMDALAGAFAYYDFNLRPVTRPRAARPTTSREMPTLPARSPKIRSIPATSSRAT